ncbi:MAG: hypothetical protein WCI43_04380, partial [Candidatus Firestonebacteria bacterium]
RANILGWKVFYVPDARALHARGGSETKSGDIKETRYAYNRKPPELRKRIIENRYYVLIKNCPLSLFLRVLPLIVVYEAAILCYITLFDTGSLPSYLNVLRKFKMMAKKRRSLNGRRRISGSGFHKWII